MFDINVLGTLLVTKAAVPHLTEGASIINISSNITSVQMADAAVYAGTKGAVDVITGVLANELGPRGIRVNAILPGATQTEGVETMTGGDSSMFDAFIAQTPLRRAGRPDDIGDVAAFLASDDARWITGERIGVSGGLR
jgi:3-oxoacyl-[acyl-carrier protein] reductase